MGTGTGTAGPWMVMLKGRDVIHGSLENHPKALLCVVFHDLRHGDLAQIWCRACALTMTDVPVSKALGTAALIPATTGFRRHHN